MAKTIIACIGLPSFVDGVSTYNADVIAFLKEKEI